MSKLNIHLTVFEMNLKKHVKGLVLMFE